MSVYYVLNYTLFYIELSVFMMYGVCSGSEWRGSRVRVFESTEQW